MILFSKRWRRSRQPRKQRKYIYDAPLHLRQGMMRVHLSKDLQKRYGRRNVLIHKGDTVKIMRGQFAKKQGKVEKVALKRDRIYVAGIDVTKKDGAKVFFPLKHSQLMIVELALDKRRIEPRKP